MRVREDRDAVDQAEADSVELRFVTVDSLPLPLPFLAAVCVYVKTI
jgi:hypothetical protein